MFGTTGDAINRLRTTNNLSVQQLADRAGLTVRTLEDIESGVNPTDDQLTALCDALGVSPDALALCCGEWPDDLKETLYDDPTAVLEALRGLGTTASNDSGEDTDDTVLADQRVLSTDQGTLYNGDARNLVGRLDGSFDCIFADPPFNLDKDYGEDFDDDRASSDYLEWTTEWLEPCVEKLADGGSLFVYNLPEWNVPIANYLMNHLTFQDWIAVDMRFSMPRPNSLYPCHYSLLYFTNGRKPGTFTPPRLPVETCPHCGGEQHDYGGHKDKMNPRGVSLTNVWEDIPPVRHGQYMNRDANQLSIKLLHRVLAMATEPGDRVLDPFGGAGTTYATCELMDRDWVGMELVDCDPIVERLENPSHDRELLDQYDNQQNVLFTREALNKRYRHAEQFGFDVEAYDLSESPTDGTQRSFEFEGTTRADE